MRLDHFLLSPRVSDRLVDAGVDRWPRGQVNASDHAPTWTMLDPLDPSCVNHELIKSKSLETRGARVLSRSFAKTRQAPGRNCHQERRAICSSARITTYAEII